MTHDQIEAMTLATKIAVLKDGVLQQFGTPAEIYNNPANMFVADFMGSPAMNLIPARIEANGGGCAVVLEPRRLATPLHLMAGADDAALRAHAGQEVIFGIRPEAITDPDGADRNAGERGQCRLPCRGGRAGRLRHLRRHQLGGKEVIGRMRADCQVGAGTARAASPSTSTRRCSSTRRRERRIA